MAEIQKSIEENEISEHGLELLDRLTDKHASLLDLIIEDLEAYNSNFYANNPDQIPGNILDDVLEIIEDVTAKIEQKRSELDEEGLELFDNLLQSYLRTIKAKSPICYKLVSSKLYNAIPGIDPNNPDNLKTYKYPIKINNIMLTITECIRFINACGLKLDKATSSSHAKIYDPHKQLEGTLAFVIAGRNTHYLENFVKQFIERKLPLERILAALDKLGYSYVLKQK